MNIDTHALAVMSEATDLVSKKLISEGDYSFAGVRHFYVNKHDVQLHADTMACSCQQDYCAGKLAVAITLLPSVETIANDENLEPIEKSVRLKHAVGKVRLSSAVGAHNVPHKRATAPAI